jgi:hypothetical protein
MNLHEDIYRIQSLLTEDLVGNYAIDYENLPKDVLDNVFIWMIDKLEYFK